MAKVSTNISIDADIKAKAQELFSDFGLDLSTAINIFLRQSIRENSIPFYITRETPKQDTLSALEEFEEYQKNPAAYKRYSSFSDLLKETK